MMVDIGVAGYIPVSLKLIFCRLTKMWISHNAAPSQSHASDLFGPV